MTISNSISKEQLTQFIQRIERLEEEKANTAIDIREVYSEAKGSGFDTKIMRQIIRLRKKGEEERTEEEYMLDVYKHALGMGTQTDLFNKEEN